MSKTASLRTETKAPLPKEISAQPFMRNGEENLHLSYPEGLGPTHAESIKIAARRKGWKMLAFKTEAGKRDDAESNNVFLGVLKPGVWTYIRSAASERRSLAAGLGHGLAGGFGVGNDIRPDAHASALILRKIGSKAAVPQANTEK
jgi:hypothetical protein